MKDLFEKLDKAIDEQQVFLDSAKANYKRLKDGFKVSATRIRKAELELSKNALEIRKLCSEIKAQM